MTHRRNRKRSHLGRPSKTIAPLQLRRLLKEDRIPRSISRATARERPRTRGDCVGGPRPCPWVGCRYHLGIEVQRRGSLMIVWPDREVWELLQTCVLDVADAGGLTLEECGELLNLTRERVRQVQARAVLKLKMDIETERLRAHLEE